YLAGPALEAPAQQARLRGVLNGILEEIPQGEDQQLGVCCNRSAGQHRIDLDLQAVARRMRVDDLVDDRASGEALVPRRLLLRVEICDVQQLPYEASGAIDGDDNLPQCRAAYGGIGRADRDLSLRSKPSQRRAQFMGGERGDFALVAARTLHLG